MPFAFNGIGSAYFGTRDLKVYQGQCTACRRQVELREYSTALWFTFLYLPVIPLGRKQVLNYCPSCRQHNELGVQQWQRWKSAKIDQARQAFVENADDPAVALRLLRALSAFEQFDEAEQLAEGIEHQFVDLAPAQMQIGDWHDFRGRPQRAHACYRRALDLDPQNLPARRAVAYGLASQGRPEEAQSLMSQAPAITAAQDPSLYVHVGKAWQRRNDHEAALVSFRQAVQAAPALARDRTVRQVIRQSESNAYVAQPVVGPDRLKPALLWAGGMALISLLAAIFTANAYIASHRTLYLVNGFAQPIEVQVDDLPSIRVPPFDVATLVVAEGRHHSHVTTGNRALESDDFEVVSSFLDRFSRTPVFLLNAGKGAAIVWEQEIVSPTVKDAVVRKMHVSQGFLKFADVDYAFDLPPDFVPSRTSPSRQTGVRMWESAPAGLLGSAFETLSVDEQMTFAETHLAIEPNDKSLLDVYTHLAMIKHRTTRAYAFLAAGLDVLPPRVEWHRFALGLGTGVDPQLELLARYDRWLVDDPNNADLLFLRGNVETSQRAAADYFDRAIAADPENRFAWYGRSGQSRARADFVQAKEELQRALADGEFDREFRESMFSLRLALGESAELERELRTNLEIFPQHAAVTRQLMEVLSATGEIGEAQKVKDRYVRELLRGREAGEAAVDNARIARERMLYFEQDYQGILDDSRRGEAAKRDEFNFSAHRRYQAHLELGQLPEAAAALAVANHPFPALDELCLSIAWRARGSDESAAQWQEAACRRMEAQSPHLAQVAALLRRAPKLEWSEVEDLAVNTSTKKVLLVALAQQSPPLRDTCLNLADKLNYSPDFPCHLLTRTIAELRALNDRQPESP